MRESLTEWAATWDASEVDTEMPGYAMPTKCIAPKDEGSWSDDDDDDCTSDVEDEEDGEDDDDTFKKGDNDNQKDGDTCKTAVKKEPTDN